MYTKTCSCGVMFATTGKSRFYCPTCSTERSRQWREQNREAVNAAQQRRRRANPTRHAELTTKARSKLRCFLAFLVSRTKSASSKRSHYFAITTDDVLMLWNQQNGKCSITGLTLEHCQNKLKSASIDRVDGTKGYTADNIQLVCKFVNLAKNTATDDEIREVFEEYAASHHKT